MSKPVYFECSIKVGASAIAFDGQGVATVKLEIPLEYQEQAKQIVNMQEQPLEGVLKINDGSPTIKQACGGDV